MGNLTLEDYDKIISVMDSLERAEIKVSDIIMKYVGSFGYNKDIVRKLAAHIKKDEYVDGKVDVPWSVYSGSPTTSLASAIAALDVYTKEELVKMMGMPTLKKALTTIIKNPYRFGMRAANVWGIARELAPKLDYGKYLLSIKIMDYYQIIKYIDDQAVADMLTSNCLLKPKDRSDVINKMVNMMSLSQIRLMRNEYGVTPDCRSCSGSMTAVGGLDIVIWLLYETGNPYMCDKLCGARGVAPEGMSDTDFVKWGRAAIDKVGAIYLAQVWRLSEEDIHACFYGGNVKEDKI